MNLIHNIYPKSIAAMRNMRYLLIVILMGFFAEGYASHIIGGDLQYKCIGNDRYEITLVFVRDCENANPEATIDNPAIVSIYDENYKPLRNVGGIASLGHLKMKNFVTDTVYDISDNPCFALAGHLCVEKTVYRDTLRLPYREGGYRLAYQRCCRNYIVQNIMEPLYTGATYETYITGDALLACNEGPQLTHIPKLYTCVGQQFTYNQKYQESDGDSIVYSLCLPNAGASYDNPMPGVHPPGPFPNIDWEQGYSTEDMMNNPADPVRISPQGIITGTPLNTGTYLIGFCIEEYRDGKLLTVSNRDFEVTVLPCDEIPIADIGNEDLYCDGLEIEFINNSTGSQDFIWYFDTSDSTLSSTEPSPTFTYADPGCYEVKLLAFRDAECYDEVTKTICVYDDTIEAALEYDVSDDCTDSMTVYFYNLSEDLDYDIVEAKWEVVLGNDTTYLTGDTVFHTFNEQGTATVTLTVTSETGCSASITEDEILINFLSIDFIADTLEICKGESSNLFENGNPDYSYTYVPEAGLDLTESSNPIASPDTSTMYVVTLTDGICTITDSILVEVKGADFGIVDLSDTCSVEKILTTNNSDHSTIQWATDADFENIIGESDTLLYDVINQQIFYVSIVDTVLNCTLTNSIVVDHKGLAFNYPSVFDICTNDADSISVKNLTDLDFTIQWDDSPIITSDLDGTTIFLETSDVGAYDLRFFAEAENGCTYEGTIRVRVNASTEANFTFTNECGSLTVEFFNLSDSSSVVWDFGDGNTSEEENPTHIYSVKGNYEVTLTVKNGCDADITKTIRIDEYEINIPDEVINCQGDLTELNPGGDPSLNYSWTPFIGIDNPTSHNPRVSVSDSTWYYVTITDDNTDCESTDSVLVVPMIGVDADFAFANDCGSLVVDFTNLSDYTDVSWDFGDGNTSEEENPTHTYQTEGVYTVTLKVNDECGNKKIMELRTREYNVNIPDQVSDCFGEGASLNPDGNPNLDYSWSPTAGLDDPASHNPTAVVSDSTWYYVTITDNDSDCESKDSVLVIPVEEFIVTTSDDVSQCGTDPVVLQASSSEGTIDWYDDSGALVGSGTSIEITPGESDFYVATATYLDCQVSDTVFVELIDFAGLFTVIAEPEEIDFGETSQISVLGDTGDYTFSWSPRDGLDDPSKRNPVARPKVTTEYCVTISDEFDCETELCVTVVVRNAPCEPPYIFLPNAFSPNGDGTNDVLYMRGEAITDLELMIYNRWGQEVFRTSDKNIGWDGTNKNGEIQPTDVYGYYYKVQCGDEGSYEEKGNVSLIR